MSGVVALQSFICSFNNDSKSKKIIKELSQKERKLFLKVIQDSEIKESTATKKLAISVLTLQSQKNFQSNRSKSFWKSMSRMMSNWFHSRISSAQIIKSIRNSSIAPPQLTPSLDDLLNKTEAPDPIKYVKGEKILPINKKKILGQRAMGGAVYEHGEDSTLAVKTTHEGEYTIGAILDHPTLAKTYNLYIKEYPDDLKKPKKRIVMDKIVGTSLTKIQNGDATISTEEAIHLLTQAKDCARYLFQQGIAWKDVNDGNIFIEKKTKDLKLIDFGFWGKIDDPHERAITLLLGSIELTGWIVRNSAAVKTNRLTKNRDLARLMLFPHEFFHEEIMQTQIVTAFVLSSFRSFPWVIATEKAMASMNEHELEDYITTYFDHVITKFMS